MAANLVSSLITKLSISNHLDSGDIRALHNVRIREQRFGARQLVVSDGQRPRDCCLIGEGFLFRSKTTRDGERQVLSIHIPGEIPDLQTLHLKIMDHDLTTISPCTLGFIAHADLNALLREHPNLASAFWRETLLDGAMFREWIVNVGRREAPARMAHLLVELHSRLRAIGHTRDGEFSLPITQSDLGDCLGLSVVHTNRVLQYLRKHGLVTASRSEFHLLAPARMEEIAGFDPTYLHLTPAS